MKYIVLKFNLPSPVADDISSDDCDSQFFMFPDHVFRVLNHTEFEVFEVMFRVYDL